MRAEALSRWFPEHPSKSQRFAYGWQLADGQRWSAEDHDDGTLLSRLLLSPVQRLELDFLVGDHTAYHFVFSEVMDIQLDGDVQFGTTERGWEVMGTDMLVAAGPRADGRLVYVLELSNTLLWFASLPPLTDCQPQ